MDHATFRNRARTCRRADGERSRIDAVVPTTRSTPGPAAASPRASRRLARRRTVGVLRGGSVRVTAQTRAQTIPPAPPEAVSGEGVRRANFVPSRNDYAYDIRRLHTIDYTLCLAARHNDHRAACERVIALGQKGAIDLRRDLAHRRRLSSIGCNVLGN